MRSTGLTREDEYSWTWSRGGSLPTPPPGRWSGKSPKKRFDSFSHPD